MPRSNHRRLRPRSFPAPALAAVTAAALQVIAAQIVAAAQTFPASTGGPLSPNITLSSGTLQFSADTDLGPAGQTIFFNGGSIELLANNFVTSNRPAVIQSSNAPI